MGSPHTPEPWNLSRSTVWGKTTAKYSVKIATASPEPGLPARDANIKRIVACVNACKGIGTEALTSLADGELAEALRWWAEKKEHTGEPT